MNKKLPLYSADPAPRHEAYSRLLSAPTTDYSIPPQMREEIGPEEECLPTREVIGMVRVRHNLLAPHLCMGQMAPLVKPLRTDRVHYVRLDGVDFVCQMKRRQGKVRIWFSDELAKQDGLETVIDADSSSLEVIGTVLAEHLNVFERTQRFWPAFRMAAN